MKWSTFAFCMCCTRNYRKNIGVGVVRNGCGHPGHKVNGWNNEWTELIFACRCKFRKVKNYFNNFWVVVAKNVHGTLISEWLDESSWFLHANNIYGS